FLPEPEPEGAEASADEGGEVAGVAWPGTSELAVLAPRLLPGISTSPATTAATTSTALAATDSSMGRDIRRRLRRLAIPLP
ncbi:MAG TPA: hypothetical protein VIZ20_11305, partial [Streptosporangiaceae bacterium]